MAQEYLFDVSPFIKPPEESDLSSGARQVWELLTRLSKRYGSAFPKQKWLAAQLRTSLRTINRWIAELRLAKILDRIWRGPTSALYILRQTFAQAVEKPRRGVPFGVPLAPHPISDSKPSTKIFRERPEIKKILERADAGVRGVLLRVLPRAERAQNPAAYLQAVSSSETRLLTTRESAPAPRLLRRPISKEEENSWAAKSLSARLEELSA